MNRIIIKEQDFTSNELTNLSSDIVYVPGFAVGGTQEARDPKLCTSISEFENAFGREAPTFLVDQVYPLKSGNNPGFDVYAIPAVSGENMLWYTQGMKDPSYVYAKELLKAGLSVVYERINKVVEKPAIANSPAFKGLFSDLEKYEVGDFVVHGNAYYTCNTAMNTPHPWDSSEWDVIPETSSEPSEVTAVWYDVTVDRMYDAMMGLNLGEDEHAIYEKDVPGALSEVSTYNVKYITSGGYPTFEYGQTLGDNTTVSIAQKMTNLAASRGDAVAFIDHTDNAARPLTGEHSVFEAVKHTSFIAEDTAGTSSFAAMITPWCIYDTSESLNVSLPGSFGYFNALARALKTYPSWLAVAGVVRGLIPSIKRLNTTHTLTNAIADYYQSIPGSTDGIPSINAITYINDRGFTIWGNRTLSRSTDKFATHFLNMRSLICDVKKRAFKAAQQYMFEQNTDILWVNFKNNMQGLLDQMVSSSAVKYYKILKVATSDRTKIAAKIQIVPIYAVETFEISIFMTDEEITVE